MLTIAALALFAATSALPSASAQTTTCDQPKPPSPCAPTTTTTLPTPTTTLPLIPNPDTQYKPPSGIFDGETGEQIGSFPDDHYDVGYDAGAWNDLERKTAGLFMSSLFAAGRLTASIGNWALGFAFDLGFVELLSEPAARLSAAYHGSGLFPILSRFALLLTVTFAGWSALRGRTSRGLGELVATIVLAVLGGLFLANPAGYLTGGFQFAGGLSQAVMEAGNTGGIQPVQEALKDTLIVTPYDLLDWGDSLQGTPCQETRDAIVADGPHGTSDEPRNRMRTNPDCAAYADFNATPTWDRVAAASLSLLATIVFVTMLTGVVVAILVAQFTAAVIVAVSPFVVVALMLPGRARTLGVAAVTTFIGSLAAVVALSLLLAVGMSALVAMLQVTNTGVLSRFFMMLVVVAALWKIRRRAVGAGKGLAMMAAASIVPGPSAGVIGGGAGTGAMVGGAAFMAHNRHRMKRWMRPGYGSHTSGGGYAGQGGEQYPRGWRELRDPSTHVQRPVRTNAQNGTPRSVATSAVRVTSRAPTRVTSRGAGWAKPQAAVWPPKGRSAP